MSKWKAIQVKSTLKQAYSAMSGVCTITLYLQTFHSRISQKKECEGMAEFTHFNKEGNAVMVDIHEKEDTYRTAVASGRIYVSRRVYEAIVDRTAKKGDVLGVARIAGIMGAKKNAELIPLCHIIALTDCEITFELCEEDCCVTAYCKTSCVGKTGVEMETLTGVSVALLTIYDMCKSMDRSMRISDIRLLEKDGGKSGQDRKSVV